MSILFGKSSTSERGIRFQTAFVVFLIITLSGPLLLVADLFFKAVKAERQSLEKSFLQEMERSINQKKQDFIQTLSRPYRDLPKLASDTLLAQGDFPRFKEVVASLQTPFIPKAIFLLASDSSVIFASGTEGLRTFQNQVKESSDKFLQSSTGLGCVTSFATGAPFLCMSFDFMEYTRLTAEDWAKRMSLDRENRLFSLVPSAEKNKWVLKPPRGSDQNLASATPRLEFPADFSPEDPALRSLFLASGTVQVACVIDHFAPGAVFILTRNATEVEIAYQEFLSHTLLKISISLVFMLCCGVLFAGMLVRPIRALDSACDRIESGNFAVTPIRSIFVELNRLDSTFHRMATRIGTRIEAADRELVERHRKLEALFQSVLDGIYLLDPSGRVVLANAVACRRLGIPELPAEGCFLDDTRKVLLAQLADQPQGLAVSFRDPVEPVWYKLIVTPLLNQSGTCFGAVAVERDITLEREIDRMKSEFVSNVSHELRTPLTSIQAYAEMLIDGESESPAQTKEYLEIIFSETERLTRLINDVLDLSRIESGRQQVKKRRLNPAEIADHAARIMEKWAVRKRHSLKTFIENSGETIVADGDLLEQALLNLLSNAIKYTPDGGTITLYAKIRDGAAFFGVRDTGIGMSENDRKQLFTKFFRSENDFVKQAGGTGLGLVLVGEIARLHGGGVEVETTLGQGSVFTLRLPVSAENRVVS
ncbi:MAG: ATP-binding protein [Candidatus Ozemobacteraceae bacterium]